MGVVALSLQRCVMAFELKQDYCDIAAKQIDEYFNNKQTVEMQLSQLPDSFSKCF